MEEKGRRRRRRGEERKGKIELSAADRIASALTGLFSGVRPVFVTTASNVKMGKGQPRNKGML